MVLRNVVPRQGTETWKRACGYAGDQLRNVVPRQGTETDTNIAIKSALLIEKCSSPTGDGNLGHCVMFSYGLLPN